MFSLESALLDPTSPAIIRVPPSEAASALAGAIESSAGAGLFVAAIDCSTLRGPVEDALLDRLAGAFQFPEYFGMNWDAVDECIRDLSWLSGRAYCLLLQNEQALKAADSRVHALLLQVLSDAGHVWTLRSVSFHVVCT